MKGPVYGLAIVPFLAGIGFAQQPMQLTNQQMDRVTAGTLVEEMSNTSAVAVSLFQRSYLLDSTPNTINCPHCYLLINSPTFSVAAQFGPGFSPGTQFPP
jgi:hypothetical protein